jgi:hypothetical protein
MPRVSTPPFRRVQKHPPVVDWSLGDDDGEFRAWSSVLLDWDPDAVIRPAVRVTIRRSAVFEETGVGPDAPLRVGLCWHCPGSQVRGSGASVVVTESGEDLVTHTLSCEVPGEDLASEVDFRVVLVLEGPGDAGQPLSARRTGSVLWEARNRIKVEGAGGRFPMAWIDFASDLPSFKDAAWFLDWDPDALDEDVLRGPRLWLNRSHPGIFQAVENAKAESSRAIFEVIHFDVGRSLIVGALRNPEFVRSNGGFPEGSLGWAISALVRATFPGISFLELASRMREAPVQFEGQLQHGLRILQALS